MASTVFVDFSDPKVNAAWLNDVNAVTYRTLVAGAGVTITPGPGTLTFSASGSGGADPFAGYTYTDRLAVRSLLTIYTNTTAKTMAVLVTPNISGGFTVDDTLEVIIRVNGAVIDYFVGTIRSDGIQSVSLSCPMTFFVPPGQTYQVEANSSFTPPGLWAWTEFNV